jgi:hypothetical protein
MIDLSELQLSLLLAGALLILSIWLVNRRQLKRIQRQQNKIMSEKNAIQRCEPTLHVMHAATQELAPLEQTIEATDLAPPKDALIETAEVASSAQPDDYLANAQLATYSVASAADADATALSTDDSLARALSDNDHSATAVEQRSATTSATQRDVVDHDELNVLTNLASSWLDSVAPVIDPMIDCVIDLPLDYPLSSERILPLLKHLRYAGNKPIYCEGFNIKRQARELIRAGQGYRDLRIAVQLANRHGPITAVELAEFISGAQHFAKNFEIAMTTPDVTQVLSQAQTLDTYAQQNDIQICLHIESSQNSWLASQLKAQFERDGLSLAPQGTHYHYYQGNHASTPIFMLSVGQVNFLYDDITHIKHKKITIYFNAPHIAQGIQAFRLTWSYAQHLAATLSGSITDDMGHALSDKAVKIIEQHLCELYARLSRYGIPAGSTNALRLFSP